MTLDSQTWGGAPGTQIRTFGEVRNTSDSVLEFSGGDYDIPGFEDLQVSMPADFMGFMRLAPGESHYGELFNFAIPESVPADTSIGVTVYRLIYFDSTACPQDDWGNCDTEWAIEHSITSNNVPITIQVSPADALPEPATSVLLLSGAAVLFAFRNKLTRT